MARLSIEQLVTTPSTVNYLADSAYDYTKWNLGKNMVKNADNTVSPVFNVIRPLEESTSFAVANAFSVKFSATIDYLFWVENSVTASATRRIHLWTINKRNNTKSWNGFITMTLWSATAHTVRDFKIDRKQETTWTVAVSGTAVTGSWTLFATNRVAVGARIGFGSTDPTQISTWYRIATRTSDTALVLNVSAGTVDAGTAYVIEEYRPIYTATNATTTNGGTHYGKGISIEDFTSGGTTISLAVSTDDQKAMYWLKDAATQTNIVAAWAAADFATATPTNLDFYVVDLVAAGNYKFYKYNIRAALTVASGASTSAFVLATWNNPFTGTWSQVANLCIATTNHGTGSGVKSLYMVTTTRVYRVPVTQITSTSTTVFSSPSDNIAEIPTGGATSYTATGVLASIEYISTKDKFLISTIGNYNYFTQYVSSGTAFDEVWGKNVAALNQTTMSPNIPLQISINGVAFIMQDNEDGIVYMCKNSTTAGIAVIYVVSIWAHWDDTRNYNLISPEIPTPNALKYYRAFANHTWKIWSQVMWYATEYFEIYARTANIRTDATSWWVEVEENNDISWFSWASAIQFLLESKTIWSNSIPAKFYGINISYEDNTTDSHFALSVWKSSLTSKIFAFLFKTAFWSTVPTLTIRLYDADTWWILLTDTTVAQAFGTFEKTTDWTNWTAYNTNDRTNSTTWIRYTPSSLADNVKVEAFLTQG